jgi:primosomal protein N' (replication factor Y)
MNPVPAAGGPRERYVAVAIDVPLRKTFTYRVPSDIGTADVRAGMRVMVPFGRGQRVAIVIDPAATADVDAAKIKPLTKVIDDEPIWPAPLWSLLGWTAAYYHHPIGEVIATAMPALLRHRATPAARPPLGYAITPAGRERLANLPASARAQARLLRLIASSPAPTAVRDLDEHVDGWRSVMRTLIRQGWVETIASAPDESPRMPPDALPALSAAQRDAVARIGDDMDRFRCVLLDGVTGSGKTEVYLQVIARAVERGRQALLLVPEIGLTAQTVERLARRFGSALCVIHSGLTDNERARAFDRARRRDVAIVVGTRSAVWTPLAAPGVIVVDEEHDLSYKQQEGLRYSARDVAVMRARREGIPIVLGSATPSLESLANVAAGRYGHVVLPYRAGNAVTPEIVVMDVRGRPLTAGISEALQKELDATVAAGQQALVFINRRGYAPSLICHGCGTVVQCRRCDARMTVHAANHRLCCHHCGAERPVPGRCESCGTADLLPVGQGTERIAGLLAQRYGQARVVRIDRDTTRRRGALDAALDEVHSSRATVLVGTQMLAKGHHFPGVTLVAVVDADGQLFSVDLRASERLAQLLVQVAGRAGRGDQPGRVFIQTHHPDHPVFQALREGGYAQISSTLLAERRSTGLPPYAFLAMLRAESTSPERPLVFLEEVASMSRSLAGMEAGVEVLGPLPAPMARRAGHFRAQLLVQSERRAELHRLLDDLLTGIERLPSARRVRWSVDVDPAELY